MIASVLTLDRQAVKILDLKDMYAIHKAIYNLFPGDSRNFLYYDQGGRYGCREILILSAEQPLVPVIGTIQSKKIPEGFLEHGQYAFQVMINPVMRKKGNARPIPIITRSALEPWFLSRQQDWGFEVFPQSLEISDLGVQEIVKSNMTITLNKAVFRGVLIVSDAGKFKRSFEQGIGRGKAFGFGLLQLRPITTKKEYQYE